MHRIGVILSVLAILFLGYVAGTAAMYFRFGNVAYFEEIYGMLEASGILVPKRQLPAPVFIGGLPPKPIDGNEPPAPDWELGVIRYDASRVEPGYTLYTGMGAWEPLRLVDMQGNTVHQWKLPRELETIKNRMDGREYPRPINPPITDAHLYPNGNVLLTLANDLGFPPFGYALVMLDKDSNVLWTYSKAVHHRLDVAENGDIAVLLNDWIEEPWPGLEKIPVPFREDQVAILGPDGAEKRVISVLQSFQDSRWQGALKQIGFDPRLTDKFHANAVRFLSATQARKIPGASAGNVLLSLRNTSLLAVLDLEKGEIVWAARGPWYMQHDPHVLKNGNILLFDNHGELKQARRSRVLEIDPVSMAIEWEWPDNRKFNLYTSIAGAVQPLQNGNVLIAETNRGRLLEVARDGDIVWEYRVAERKKKRNKKGREYMVTKAWNPQRYASDYLKFL